MNNELISLEQHLWGLFDVWKKITQEKDDLWYKQLFGQMRTLVADRAQKPKPLMLRLFDEYKYRPNVMIDAHSPRPTREVKFEDYLKEPVYASSIDKMKNPKIFLLCDLLYQIASNDSTSHEKKELPEILNFAQIGWGNSRFDIIQFTHAASRTIVCGVDFLKKMEEEGKYKVIRGWDMNQIDKIRKHYWL